MSIQTNITYLPRFWNDGSGYLGQRLTLSASSAAIASTLILIFVSLTIQRLGQLLHRTSLIFFLYRRSNSVLDDQTNTIVANDSSPTGTLRALFYLTTSFRLQVLSSP